MKRGKVCLVPLLALMFVFTLALSGAWAGDGVVNTSVSDFRVNLDRTITDTSKPVNVVVELLDDQGRVDVFAETSVNYIYVSAGSVIGTINYKPEGYSGTYSESGNDIGEFAAQTAKIAVTNGRAGFHISYDQPGTDTLRFYVVIVDTDGDTLTLGPKEYTVTVTQAPNQAKALMVVSMTPDDEEKRDNEGINYEYNTDGTVATDASDNSSGQIDAGEAFTLQIKACADETCSSTTNYQNGPITVKFVPVDAADTDGNNAYSSDCANVVTVEGTMENGVAFVHVPEGTLTKAGKYAIYLEMDSAVTTSGKAYQVANAHIYVDALEPAKVGASLDRDDINYYNTPPSPTLTVTLYDQYDNKADTDDVTSAVDVTVAATNHVLLGGGTSTTVTINSGDNQNTFSNFSVDTGSNAPSINESTGTGTSTISIACNDYEVDTPELTLTIYKKRLVAQYLDSTGNYVNSASQTYTAGIVLDDAIRVGVDDNGTTTWDELKTEQVIVELYDGDTKVDEVKSMVDDNGYVSLKFNKALTGGGDEYFKIFCVSCDKQYQPGKTNDATITVNPADAYVMKVYKNQSAEYNACAGTGTPTEEVSSISKTLSGGNASITFHGSQDESLSSGDYFVKIEDAYGNEIKSGTIYWESDEDPINPTPSSGFFLVDDNDTITYNEAGSDNLTFSTDIPGVEPVSVAVTISDTSAYIASVEVVPATEYVLTNGEIPVVIRAKDQNGNLISWGANDLILLVDHPDYVTIRQSDRATTIANGDNLPADTDGEYVISLVALNTVSDVTITVRNASGSVEGSATVHIVNSINDIPVPVAAVSFSPSSVMVAPNGSVDVTLSVTDSEGNGLANKTCTLESDAENIATPASTTVTTGSDGTATVTINAGSVEGEAHITATCEGVSGVVTVTVSEEAQECTPETPENCKTQEDCEAVGAYWYDGVCHAEQAPCDADHLWACEKEEDCENAGGYWYDGVCNAEPAVCDADHLWACEKEDECEAVGGYWYNGICNEAAFNGAPAEPMPGHAIDEVVTEPYAMIEADNDAQEAMVIIPSLVVPQDRIGDTVHLYWTWCNDYTCAPDVYDLGPVTLGETVDFPIVASEVDLSAIRGNFYIFVGFAANEDFSDAIWNWYELDLD